MRINNQSWNYIVLVIQIVAPQLAQYKLMYVIGKGGFGRVLYFISIGLEGPTIQKILCNEGNVKGKVV